MLKPCILTSPLTFVLAAGAGPGGVLGAHHTRVCAGSADAPARVRWPVHLLHRDRHRPHGHHREAHLWTVSGVSLQILAQYRLMRMGERAVCLGHLRRSVGLVQFS